MYTLEAYIKKNVQQLSWITDAEKQIISVAGLDKAASILQNYADNIYPIILIEDTTGGHISYQSEFFDTSVHNFWVMDKPKHPDIVSERKETMKKCYTQGIDIIKIMVEDDNIADRSYGWNENRTRWDRKKTYYMPMSNIGLCYGWLFMLTFITDLNL
jgi:hypothetical protein